MKKIKGFTLVELLVVISIIALLLSVLMPSLRKASEQAKFIICKSNLHNYALAGSMYLDSNNNAFPHPTVCIYSWSTFTAEHPGDCRWHDAGVTPDGPMWPYLKSKDVHRCPSFAAIARTRGTKHPGHIASIPIEPTFTYSMNGRLGAGDSYEPLGDKLGQMTKLGQVKRPGRVLFFTEENIWIIRKNNGDALTLSNFALNNMHFGTQRYGMGDCIATFHKATDSAMNTGYSNVLFVDGHVSGEKAYDQSDISRTYSDKSMRLTFGVDKLIQGVHY